jgi:branched-chain amino acid transport system substrate-binding protein
MTLPRLASVLVVLTSATVLYQSVSEPDTPGGAVAAACGNKIAYLADGSGREQPGLQAAQLAVDRYNVEHPGCVVQLAEYNTQNTGGDDLTAQAADAIVADRQVLGVIGPVSADTANIALPVLEKAGVVAVSPALSDDVVGGPGYHVFHRVVGSADDDTTAAIRWLTATVPAAKVFVVDDDYDDTVANAKLAKRLLGTAVAGSASVDDPNAGNAAVLSAIRASNASAVYYSGHTDTFDTLVPKIRAARPQITILGAHWVVNGLSPTDRAPANNRVFVTNPNTVPAQASRAFAAEYLAKYKKAPGYFGPEGYDAANILLSGLSAGRYTRPQLLTWVDQFHGQGATGAIAFKPNGDRTDPTVVVMRVSDDQFSGPEVIAGGQRQSATTGA